MYATLSAILETDLRTKLRDPTSLLVRGDQNFRKTTERWTEWQGPDFAAVVIARDESDIQSVLSFARKHNVPFLVSTGKHADFSTLNKIKDGIHIEMSHLNKVEVSSDGQSATVGGGIMVKDLARELLAHGKVTVTGVCEVVGIGSWLGGGHGLLQGQFGLAADQIIEARVMLGDGQVVTASESSNSDLFWALKGAGHNFGVVTEMKIRIYDSKPYETWTHEAHIFSGDQIEVVFAGLKEMKRNQGPTDQHFVLFRKLPEIDREKVVVMVLACSAGDTNTTHLTEYTKLLHGIPSINVMRGESSLLDMPKIFGCDEAGTYSQKGATYMMDPIDLVEYDIPAVRQAYEIFDRGMRDLPALADNSTLIFEGYPVQAVQAVPAASTAFPWRGDTLLVCPFITYVPDPDLDSEAHALSVSIQNVLHQGSGRKELHTYVNYASGPESLESMYGDEPWRLEKLREVKAKYDPHDLFSFYAAIR